MIYNDLSGDDKNNTLKKLDSSRELDRGCRNNEQGTDMRCEGGLGNKWDVGPNERKWSRAQFKGLWPG